MKDREKVPHLKVTLPSVEKSSMSYSTRCRSGRSQTCSAGTPPFEGPSTTVSISRLLADVSARP